MKVIFMGTPDFSVGTLEALAEAGHEVVLAVTQPDKPKGRGGKMQYTPVKEAALARDIPVYQPKKIREPECIEELKKYNADINGCLLRFGQILPKEILQMTPYAALMSMHLYFQSIEELHRFSGQSLMVRRFPV